MGCEVGWRPTPVVRDGSRTVGDMSEPPQQDPCPPGPRVHVHPWWEPPREETPAILPVVIPLVRTPTAALSLVGAHVYRQGVELRLERRMRRCGETDDEWQAKIRGFLESPGLQAVPGGSVDLQYSVITEGQEVFANSLFRGYSDVNSRPSGLSVMRTGSGASADIWLCQSSEGLWLWPLPSGDHLDVVARWPAVGIAFASAAVPTSGLEVMAQQSTPLWDTTT